MKRIFVIIAVIVSGSVVCLASAWFFRDAILRFVLLKRLQAVSDLAMTVQGLTTKLELGSNRFSAVIQGTLEEAPFFATAQGTLLPFVLEDHLFRLRGFPLERINPLLEKKKKGYVFLSGTGDVVSSGKISREALDINARVSLSVFHVREKKFSLRINPEEEKLGEHHREDLSFVVTITGSLNHPKVGWPEDIELSIAPFKKHLRSFWKRTHRIKNFFPKIRKGKGG